MVKNPSANAGDVRDASLIPRAGGSPGERNGNPLLGNPVDSGTRQAPAHGVMKSWT